MIPLPTEREGHGLCMPATAASSFGRLRSPVRYILLDRITRLSPPEVAHGIKCVSLSDDIFATPADIPAAKVEVTIFDGKVVYRRGQHATN